MRRAQRSKCVRALFRGRVSLRRHSLLRIVIPASFPTLPGPNAKPSCVTACFRSHLEDPRSSPQERCTSGRFTSASLFSATRWRFSTLPLSSFATRQRLRNHKEFPFMQKTPSPLEVSFAMRYRFRFASRYMNQKCRPGRFATQRLAPRDRNRYLSGRAAHSLSFSARTAAIANCVAVFSFARFFRQVAFAPQTVCAVNHFLNRAPQHNSSPRRTFFRRRNRKHVWLARRSRTICRWRIALQHPHGHYCRQQRA